MDYGRDRYGGSYHGGYHGDRPRDGYSYSSYKSYGCGGSHGSQTNVTKDDEKIIFYLFIGIFTILTVLVVVGYLLLLLLIKHPFFITLFLLYPLFTRILRLCYRVVSQPNKHTALMEELFGLFLSKPRIDDVVGDCEVKLSNGVPKRKVWAECLWSCFRLFCEFLARLFRRTPR